MSDVLNTLFKVQEYELRVDAARERIDEIESALAHDDALQQAQQAYDEAKASAEGLRAKANDLDLELASLREKIDTVNQMLYDGSITNPKELQERQQEVESLTRREEVLSLQLEHLKTEAQEADVTFEEALETLTTAQVQNEVENAELVVEREELDKMVKETLRQRKTIIEDIPKPMLKQFRALRKKKGQAIAPLNGNACGVCNIEQPSLDVRRIMNGEDVIRCVGCGRIIIGNIYS